MDKIALLLRRMTVEAAALFLPLEDFVRRSVKHQKLPVICFGIETADAFDHHGQELRSRIVSFG